jgi:hypothetical protein
MYDKFYILEKDYTGSLVESWKNLSIIPSIKQANDCTPMIMGGDILRKEVRDRLNAGSPTIYIHRGYLGNHIFKIRQWWRYSVNSFANTKLLNIPYERWHLLNLPKHPWKVKKIKNILIAPSKMTSLIWNPELGTSWAESLSNRFPGAKIKIRIKDKTARLRWASLWSDLDWADLVISQSSAITVEALWYGKKVISLYPCPTWAAGASSNFDDWQNPSEPKYRDIWHEHIAWCQFKNEEWYSGEARELIKRYVGSVERYDPEYTYSFNSVNMSS